MYTTSNRLTSPVCPPQVKAAPTAADKLAVALAELRELARGLHPAVVTAHGLAVALESLTARAPVPVRLAVDLPGYGKSDKPGGFPYTMEAMADETYQSLYRRYRPRRHVQRSGLRDHLWEPHVHQG